MRGKAKIGTWCCTRCRGFAGGRFGRKWRVCLGDYGGELVCKSCLEKFSRTWSRFFEDFAGAGCWVGYDRVGSRTHPTDRSGSRMPRWLDAAKCGCGGWQEGWMRYRKLVCQQKIACWLLGCGQATGYAQDRMCKNTLIADPPFFLQHPCKLDTILVQPVCADVNR